jgi:hypothetical protein
MMIFFFLIDAIKGAVKCDIFVGDWVQDLSGPMYTNESCHVIQDPQNCIRNGRPDLGYLYWRWKPKGCELPKFNPKEFLHNMTNKSLAFIGDSISRNHVQSLLCILSKVQLLSSTNQFAYCTCIVLFLVCYVKIANMFSSQFKIAVEITL